MDQNADDQRSQSQLGNNLQRASVYVDDNASFDEPMRVSVAAKRQTDVNQPAYVPTSHVKQLSERQSIYSSDFYSQKPYSNESRNPTV